MSPFEVTIYYYFVFHKYFSQGFIDPICGFITLLQLITTSNWHSVMNSVAAASGAWAYVYFILFYIAIDLILLDLMIAIAIEMYNAVRSQFEDAFGDQPGICFEVCLSTSSVVVTNDDIVLCHGLVKSLIWMIFL